MSRLIFKFQTGRLSCSTIGEGGDTTIPSPGRSPKPPLPGIGLQHPLHGRQTCPEFNLFHQGVGNICPRLGLCPCRLPKRGQICYIPPLIVGMVGYRLPIFCGPSSHFVPQVLVFRLLAQPIAGHIQERKYRNNCSGYNMFLYSFLYLCGSMCLCGHHI